MNIINNLYRTKIFISKENTSYPEAYSVSVFLLDFNNELITNVDSVTLECENAALYPTASDGSLDSSVTASRTLTIQGDGEFRAWVVVTNSQEDKGQLVTLSCNETKLQFLQKNTYVGTPNYESGYSDYTNLSFGGVRIYRQGRIVRMFGQWKSSSARTSSTTDVKFMTLPSAKLAPIYDVTTLQKGTGINVYLLWITPEGEVYWARHGNSGYVNIPANTQLNIDVSWIAQENIGES